MSEILLTAVNDWLSDDANRKAFAQDPKGCLEEELEVTIANLVVDDSGRVARLEFSAAVAPGVVTRSRVIGGLTNEEMWWITQRGG